LLPATTPPSPPIGKGGSGGGGTLGRKSTVFHSLLMNLHAHQQAVSLTPETRAERTLERQITRRGYGVVLAGWLSMLAIAGWFLANRF
jgi:hypothetical protein